MLVKKTEHVLTETLTNILIYFVEQEIKSNRKVSKIELWDEAHKKKDGNYTSDNVKTIMVHSTYFVYSPTYNLFHSIVMN